ncbi:MAG: hypothetical protein OFPI_15150 [Osedax symbiont Rs2]|nr:MAG: hypothetical protein OFPI_15150 [Osedax symbiont Rs2]
MAKQSLLQKIDPRARIACTLLFAFAVVLSEQLIALIFALTISVIVAVVAKLAVAKTLKKLAAMDIFMLYLLLMLPFTVPGDGFIMLFGFQGSWQGLEQGIKITLKANAVVLMLFATVANLSSSALGSALQALKVSNKLIQLLLFTLRYLSVIEDEYKRLRRSMRARAFVMKFNWHSWKSIGNLIAMLLVRSMHRSQRILKAMKCRGYNGQLVSYLPMRWQPIDSAYCAAMALLTTVIIVINFIHVS